MSPSAEERAEFKRAELERIRPAFLSMHPQTLPELVSHVAGPDKEHPRWHYESGECDQYRGHYHGEGFIVWIRGEAGTEVLP